VVHLHGQIFEMRSVKNTEKIFEIRGDIHLGDLAEDGGQLRPNIVWFEEAVPMIEIAADITLLADIFAVVGTSLQVYPAAGLLQYAPKYIPKFMVDKKIPSTSNSQQLTLIEQPATQGVQILKNYLLKLID
jgi:NAD-dependent deacetylase